MMENQMFRERKAYVNLGKGTQTVLFPPVRKEDGKKWRWTTSASWDEVFG